MWEKVKNAVEQHPYLTAGLTLGLVVLIWWYSSSGAAPAQSSGIYGISQDPNVVAANAAQAISQNQTNAAVDMNNVNTAASLNASNTLTAAQQDVMNKQTQAAVALATIQNSSALSALQNNNQTALTIAGLQATVASQSITAAETVATGQTSAGIQLADLSYGLSQSALAGAMTEHAQINLSSPLVNFQIGAPNTATTTPTPTPTPTPVPTPSQQTTPLGYLIDELGSHNNTGANVSAMNTAIHNLFDSLVAAGTPANQAATTANSFGASLARPGFQFV